MGLSENERRAVEEIERRADELVKLTTDLISFDTTHDTPEVLKRFGRSLAGKGPQPFAHWAFASGTDAEIRKLGNALGLEYDPDTGMWVHNLRTAVIGADGTLVRVIHGNDWKPAELVADLRAAADRR